MQLQRQVFAVCAKQSDRNRNMERQLFVLARRGGAGLSQRKLACFGRLVILNLHLDQRRACLTVPAFELRQIPSVRIGHLGAENNTENGLPVVPTEKQDQAQTEENTPEQSLVH